MVSWRAGDKGGWRDAGKGGWRDAGKGDWGKKGERAQEGRFGRGLDRVTPSSFKGKRGGLSGCGERPVVIGE